MKNAALFLPFLPQPLPTLKPTRELFLFPFPWLFAEMAQPKRKPNLLNKRLQYVYEHAETNTDGCAQTEDKMDALQSPTNNHLHALVYIKKTR